MVAASSAAAAMVLPLGLGWVQHPARYLHHTHNTQHGAQHTYNITHNTQHGAYIQQHTTWSTTHIQQHTQHTTWSIHTTPHTTLNMQLTCNSTDLLTNKMSMNHTNRRPTFNIQDIIQRIHQSQYHTHHKHKHWHWVGAKCCNVD